MQRCLNQLRQLTLNELNTLASNDWGFTWGYLLKQVIREKEILGR